MVNVRLLLIILVILALIILLLYFLRETGMNNQTVGETFQEFFPIASENDSSETPTSSFVETPTSSFAETPTSSFAETPTSSFVETPTSSFVETPTSSFVETPTSSFAETPTSSFTETPTSYFAETPTSSLVETPTSSFVETPTSSFVETPTSSFVETPTSSFVETPTSYFAETPTSSFVETPTSSFAETPTSSLVETPTSSFAETPTSSFAETPAVNIIRFDDVFESECYRKTIAVDKEENIDGCCSYGIDISKILPNEPITFTAHYDSCSLEISNISNIFKSKKTLYYFVLFRGNTGNNSLNLNFYIPEIFKNANQKVFIIISNFSNFQRTVYIKSTSLPDIEPKIIKAFQKNLGPIRIQ